MKGNKINLLDAKFPVLFSLYIAQSIPMSFFSTVVPVIMRQESYSLESIGLLQLVKLPWIFKFLWAPLVDNKTRTKEQLRQWIIVSELVYASIILCIGLFDLQTDFTTIIILMLMAFTASATQDIATDIFAIHVLKDKERSFGNSIQSAGSFIGSLVGTGVLLILYHYFGWTGLVHGLALCVAFAVIPIAIYKGKINIPKTATQKIKFIEIGRYFKDKTLRRRTVLLTFYYSGLIGMLTLLKPYLVDLGYNVKQIGFMSGIVGTSVATVAALSAGFIISKIGKKTSFYVFLLMSFLTASYFYMLPTTPSIGQLYVAICMLWGSYGLSTVIIYTTSMDAVRPGREGTDFTLQIVITHLSGIIIAVTSGRLGDKLGYKGIYEMEMILCVITFVILLWLMPITKRKNRIDIKEA